MTEAGKLIVVSGPSGVGKDTVVSRFLENAPDCLLSVSATTRPPRPGEVEGRDYFFVAREVFLRMIAEDKMLEYAEYNGNYYGTPRDMVDKSLAAGKHVILIIEVQGAAKIRALYPQALFVFIMPPSPEALRERLLGRATENEASLLGRMQTAQEEMARAREYDFILVNNDVGLCAGELAELIRAARPH